MWSHSKCKSTFEVYSTMKKCYKTGMGVDVRNEGGAMLEWGGAYKEWLVSTVKKQKQKQLVIYHIAAC